MNRWASVLPHGTRLQNINPTLNPIIQNNKIHPTANFIVQTEYRSFFGRHSQHEINIVPNIFILAPKCKSLSMNNDMMCFRFPNEWDCLDTTKTLAF
jgi:hypothetical protein